MGWYDQTDEYMGETFWCVDEFFKALTKSCPIVAERQNLDAILIDDHTKQILYRIGCEWTGDDPPVIIAVTCHQIYCHSDEIEVFLLVAFENVKVETEIEPPDFRSRKNTKWKKLFRDKLVEMFSALDKYPYMKKFKNQFELATRPTRKGRTE